MSKLEALRGQVPEVRYLQMQADGYAIWIVWPGEVNPVLVQTLEEYGGVRIAEDEGQSLWFFFTSDVLLAAARLSVWARFNQLAVTMALFPARMQVGTEGDKSLIFDEAIWKLNLDLPQDFKIWGHASMVPLAEGIPGVSLISAIDVPSGLDSSIWLHLEADGRLPYQSSMGWYVVMRPVGNPLDKNFQTGWREFFNHVEAVLQRNKFRFTIHDFFLMFPLEGLTQFRNWCRDFLTLVERVKEENSEQYWPCVMAIIERKGLNFNQDLPSKVAVAWEQLTPDYPHMFIRNALMLGDEFAFHEVRFAPSHQAPDDWASVSLRTGEEERRGVLPQLAPTSLITGTQPHCFYCGQRSHAPSDCPVRTFPPHESKVWNRVAQLDFAAMRGAVQEIDTALAEAGENRNEAINTLAREQSASGVLLDAYFDINWVVQPRAMRLFWRARNKEFHKISSDLIPQDSSPIWEVMEQFPERDLLELDKELAALAMRYPKDFRIMSLRGFVAMERGELEKAQLYWKDAEVYSSFPIVQTWHQMLQARLLEYQGRYTQAGNLYAQVYRATPTWLDAEYRRLVCDVKSGFSGTASTALTALVDRNGHYFNKALLDPEMERGHVQIHACLYALWVEMEARAKDEAAKMYKLRDELPSWFMPAHPFAERMADQVHRLMQVVTVNNYVAFQMLATGRMQLEKEMQTFVNQESKDMKNRFKSYTERLKVIHEESAWFPFPRALVDFNKNYNISVANLNWALTANFHLPDPFRKAQMLLEQEEERLKKMESRLKFLRIIRDSTLFLLSVGETFFWVELVGIILIFVLMPLLLIYGDKIGLDWTASVIAKERWSVQKAMFFVISILALAVACLRTILRFEYIRDKILTKAKNTTRRVVRKKQE